MVASWLAKGQSAGLFFAAYHLCESVSVKGSQRRLDAYDIRVAGVGTQVPVSFLSCACAEGALLCCLTIPNMVCGAGVFLQAPGYHTLLCGGSNLGNTERLL